MPPHSIAACAAALLLTLAGVGRAEPVPPVAVTSKVAVTLAARPPASTNPPEDTRGYTYEFTDDPLAAGGFDAHDARIVVAKHGVRTTLIRPRTAFVVELLKTVENL